MIKRILDAIDDMLLDATQRVSDVVYDAFDIDHWKVAGGFLNLSLACAIVYTGLAYEQSKRTIMSAIGSAVFVALWCICHQTWSRSLARARASGDAGRALRVTERNTRQADFLITSIISLVEIMSPDVPGAFFMATMASFQLHYHFKAASMPPPRTNERLAWQG